jgi:hypothetical protein
VCIGDRRCEGRVRLLREEAGMGGEVLGLLVDYFDFGRRLVCGVGLMGLGLLLEGLLVLGGMRLCRGWSLKGLRATTLRPPLGSFDVGLSRQYEVRRTVAADREGSS